MSQTRTRGKSEVSRVQLVTMGPGGVGKSCIVLRLIMDDFVEDYDPTIEDNYRKQICVDHKPLVLDIMDTAGQEEFNMLEDQWIRMGEGFLLVFDVMDSSSVDICEEKYTKILRQKEMDNVPVVMIGNKIDLLKKRNLTSTPAIDKAKALVQKWGSCVTYMETSAKNGTNVTECFEEGIRSVRKWRQTQEVSVKPSTGWCTIF